MTTLNVFARATAPAWKSFALFGVWMLAQGYGIQACALQTVDVPVTGPTVTVTPIAAWQSQHPYCTVSAITDDCGVTPSVTITGSDCYPGSGQVEIANVVVEDEAAHCIHTYLVRADGGTVQVVMVDP